MMHEEPPPIFTREPWVVPYGTMLFCALLNIDGGIAGHTIFFSWIISCWAAIRWEGEMFYDLSEVDLGFGHFMRYCLEVLQGDASGY